MPGKQKHVKKSNNADNACETRTRKAKRQAGSGRKGAAKNAAVAAKKPRKIVGRVRTSGDGLWSSKQVELDIEIAACEPGCEHIVAFFSPKKWKVDEDGLIYTDSLFEAGVVSLLLQHGFKNARDLSYSEAGAQGKDFVDFDASPELCQELIDYLSK